MTDAGAATLPGSQPHAGDGTVVERRRRTGLSTGELISVIALVSGGIAWLTNVSIIAGRSDNRLEKVEAEMTVVRGTLDSVKDSVSQLRVDIEGGRADLRERLARIEAMLAAAAAAVNK